ncbi:uncharacterized protein PRCAT00000997001 [Priceomyces carsonii]|uniref:uncharacterized protein n=1 Tax=Priceomyces carsonii TaxID=28549 RepID=UPI002ED9D3F0|nr:unnamed protein product [Priceomyces carsonii]
MNHVSNLSRNNTRRRNKDRQVEDENEPLIPSALMDQATQRILLVTLFILLQSFKIRDSLFLKLYYSENGALGTSTGNFMFVLKYAVLDGLFLWLLPILNIEYITFSPFKTLILTLFLNATTILLVSDISNTIISASSSLILPLLKFFVNRKELTIGGDSVSPSNFVDMNSHFKGRYTIHYLPDSSVKFNPFHFDKLCIDTHDGNFLKMPIQFNTTTELGSLKIEHIKPNNESSYISYSHRGLSKLLKEDHSHLKKYPDFVSEDRIFYIEVPISEPGSYRIANVKDTNGANIRSYKSEFTWTYCPSANFEYAANFNPSANYKCLNDQDKNFNAPQVIIRGVQPISVKLDMVLNGERINTLNYTIDETNIAFKDLNRLNYSTSIRDIITEASSKFLETFSKTRATKLEFQLNEVTDYFGNSKRYNPSSRDKDVWYWVDLKPSPKILLEDPKPDNLLLINGSKLLSVSIDESISQDDFPLIVDFSYINSKSDLLSFNFTKTFKDINELRSGLEVEKPGEYYILASQNKFCACKTLSERVLIRNALLPDLNIHAKPLIDKCLGMTGYDFQFTVQGKAPFEIQYHVYQNQSNGILKPVHNEKGLTNRVLKSFSKDFEFKYSPPGEGNYIVVFDGIKDSNYKKKMIPLNKTLYTYLTHFNQRSSASFRDHSRSRRIEKACLGDSVEIPLSLSGNFPFHFEIIIQNLKTGQNIMKKRQVSTNSSTYMISTPALVKGGDYEIKLLNLKDGLSCNVAYDSDESVIVKVRNDVPQLNFASSSKELKLIRGESLTIPLQLESSSSNNARNHLIYSFEDLNSKASERTSQNLEFLQVREAGVYKLLSFTNDGCNGRIGTLDTVAISYYPKPNMTVITKDTLKQHFEEKFLHLEPRCQNCVNKLDLRLTGVKPFIVDYEIRFPNGRKESRSMTSHDENISINLQTSQSGSYEHRFMGVYDKLYTKEKTQNVPDISLPTIRYDVNPTPSSSFDDPKRLHICEANLDTDMKIPVNFKGEYPFALNVSLSNTNGALINHFNVHDIQEPALELSNFIRGMKPGDYKLTMTQIRDSNGCQNNDIALKNTALVSITKVPNIVKSYPKSHYCVGDHISYNVTGISPFTIYYEFEGKVQKARLEHRFQRLASKPGELSIVGVLDSSDSNCLVNVSRASTAFEDLKLHIYDLPSVELNEGDIISRDLHQGDQTEIHFSFSGTPPFRLTYTRTSELRSKPKNSKSGRKDDYTVETKTIEGIWEYKYTITASLEGTYEAVEVLDAFCVATRYSQEPHSWSTK